MTISRCRNVSLHFRNGPLQRRRVEAVQRVAGVIVIVVVTATKLEILSEYKWQIGIVCPFLGAPKIKERNTY